LRQARLTKVELGRLSLQTYVRPRRQQVRSQADDSKARLVDPRGSLIQDANQSPSVRDRAGDSGPARFLRERHDVTPEPAAGLLTEVAEPRRRLNGRKKMQPRGGKALRKHIALLRTVSLEPGSAGPRPI